MSYITDDELVEVTPKSIRLRKRWLDPNERKRRNARKTATKPPEHRADLHQTTRGFAAPFSCSNFKLGGQNWGGLGLLPMRRLDVKNQW